MKLRDVPDPVWYGLLAVIAVGGIYWLSKRTAGAVGEVLSTSLNPASDKNAAYQGVNAVGQALGVISPQDSLGTSVYGWTHTASDPNAAPGTMASQDRSIFDATTWGAPGRWWYTLWYGEESAALYYGDKPATSGATGSWSSNGPYDYGTSGTSGVPWSPQAKPLPDLFNFSLDYIR